ncbi:MAG TPA: hemolysin family protein [Elusimicrobiota bacterium]|nr:hemolysin family protein [Elusimicrobiota bacterium]
MIFLVIKLILFAGLLLCCGAFSVGETAFMSLSRVQLIRLRKTFPGRFVFWENDPARVVAAILLGTNLANVGLATLATSMAYDCHKLFSLPFRLGGWLFPLIATILLIAFGEILPKVWARLRPDVMAVRVLPFISLSSYLFGPVIHGLVRGTQGAMGRISASLKPEPATVQKGAVHHLPALRALLANTSLEPMLSSLLNNVLELGHLPVSRIMVPREEIFAADIGLSKDLFIQRILSSTYSRIPVYKGSLDSIVGIVYAKDLLTSWRSGDIIVLQDLLRPALKVSPETPVADLLREFRRGHHHIAIVMGPQGRVQGLATIQEILESIVGDISDEPESCPLHLPVNPISRMTQP